MANTITTMTQVLRECMRSFQANLGLANHVDRQYDDQYKNKGAKHGATLYVRKPNKATVVKARAMQTTDMGEENQSITVATQAHVALTVNSAELALKIPREDFVKRFIRQPMAQLAATVDSDGCAEFYKISNQVGAAGTVPSSLATYLAAGQKLDENMAPPNDRFVVINPPAQAAAAAVHIALQNSSLSGVNSIYQKGRMGEALGFEWYMDQQINSITCGTRTNTTPLVDDAAAANATQGSTTIHIDGLASATATIAAGDIFTVAGVYAVNPLTGASYSHLKQFTCLALATAASNEVDITVDAMYTTGPKKNQDSFPVDEAAITFVGTASTAYAQNLAFQKEAIALVTADLPIVNGAHFCQQETFDGITMRLWQDGDIRNDEIPCRVDILYGWQVMRPEWACRITA